MGQGKNADAFAELFGITYNIACKGAVSSAPILLTCRALPFTTVTHVLAQLAVSTQNEILRARKTIVEEFSELAPQIASGEEGWKTILADRASIPKLIAIIEPLLTGLIATTPELTERILRDVVVDIKADQVRKIPAEVGLQILAEAIDRTDKELIARQAQAVFFGLTEAVTKVLNRDQKKTDNESSSDDTASEPESSESETPNSS